MPDTTNPFPHAFVCCPFDLLLGRFQEQILSYRLNPEIGLNNGVLDRYLATDFIRAANLLKDNELQTTIHAPFSDLSIGALDPLVRDVTKTRLSKALEIAAIFDAKSVVVHSGFDTWHYAGHKQEWLDNATGLLEELVSLAERLDMYIALENVFELGPDMHEELFKRIDSPRLGFCLDLGHQNVFSATGLLVWLETLGKWLRHIHLHDNKGKRDEHLCLGSGNVEFETFFKWLKHEEKNVVMTIEAHRDKDVLPSLKALSSYMSRFEIVM